MTDPQPLLVNGEDRGWRTPIVITRLTAAVYSGLISMCFVLVIVAAVFYLNDRHTQTVNRQKHDASQIAQLQAVTRDLKAITNPTPDQYKQQLSEGIKRCLQTPECRKLFPKISETP